jgi:hypothetical protein
MGRLISSTTQMQTRTGTTFEVRCDGFFLSFLFHFKVHFSLVQYLSVCEFFIRCPAHFSPPPLVFMFFTFLLIDVFFFCPDVRTVLPIILFFLLVCT